MRSSPRHLPNGAPPFDTARSYDSAIGRFLSADTIVPTLSGIGAPAPCRALVSEQPIYPARKEEADGHNLDLQHH